MTKRLFIAVFLLIAIADTASAQLIGWRFWNKPYNIDYGISSSSDTLRVYNEDSQLKIYSTFPINISNLVTDISTASITGDTLDFDAGDLQYLPNAPDTVNLAFKNPSEGAVRYLYVQADTSNVAVNIPASADSPNSVRNILENTNVMFQVFYFNSTYVVTWGDQLD